MRRKNAWLLSVGIVFMVLIFMGTGCSISSGSSSVPTEEKKHVEATAEWAYLTFEETVEKADIIIYGTAGERSETKTRSGGSGDNPLDYYREIPIQVKNVVKGQGIGDTAIYREYGGETKDAVYSFRDFPLLESGKEYVLFLNKQGYSLFPSTIIPVEDGQISTFLAPDSVKESIQKEQESESAGDVKVILPVQDYITLIQENLG